MPTVAFDVAVASSPPTGYQTYPPVWPVPVSSSRSPQRVRDMVYGGDGTVYGTVKTKATPDNLPVSRRVRLYQTKDMVLIRETWSDPVTGAYSFGQIAQGQDYTVIAHDYQQTFRAIGADLFNI